MRLAPAFQAALLLAGTAVAVPHSASAAPLAQSNDPGSLDSVRALMETVETVCGVLGPLPLALASAPRDDGTSEYQDWLSNERSQAALPQLWELEQKLQAQVLGLAIDHVNRRMVFVADPELDADARRTIADQVAALELPFAVGVVDGCNSKAELSRVIETLAAERATLYGDKKFVFALDPETAQVVVTTDDDALGTDLVKRFGDLVAIDRAAGAPTPLAGGRLNDASPHYGDARLDVGCTSNVPMVSGYGVRASMTAAHCGGNGTVYKSGGNLYGTGVSANSTTGDYVMIYDASQTYDKRFYTDPGSPTTRTVSGKVDVGVGSFVCAGGSYSLADCGAEIWQSTTFPTPNGSTSVWGARRAANQGWICQPGDSGGVVYQRSGTSGSLVAGLITGGIVDGSGNPTPVFGYHVCYFQAMSQIEAQSGYKMA